MGGRTAEVHRGASVHTDRDKVLSHDVEQRRLRVSELRPLRHPSSSARGSAGQDKLLRNPPRRAHTSHRITIDTASRIPPKMAALESPTVLTRRPTSVSPPLPPSPAPSRAHPRERHHNNLSLEMSIRGRNLLRRSGSGSSTPDWMEEQHDVDDAATAREVSGPEPRKDEGREPWWRELSKRWRLMLTLENSGSVARDHLASERTFLAYTRTSLTIASTGVGASDSLLTPPLPPSPPRAVWAEPCLCSARAAVHPLGGDDEQGHAAIRAAAGCGDDWARAIYLVRRRRAVLPRPGRAHPRRLPCRARQHERAVSHHLRVRHRRFRHRHRCEVTQEVRVPEDQPARAETSRDSGGFRRMNQIANTRSSRRHRIYPSTSSLPPIATSPPSTDHVSAFQRRRLASILLHLR